MSRVKKYAHYEYIAYIQIAYFIILNIFLQNNAEKYIIINSIC